MVPQLKLVSTNDENMGVEVDTAKEALTNGLDSLSVVSSYAHAMLNTNINPVVTPPPGWYTTLNSNLGVAKTHALKWVSDLAPKIGSTIPQTIINYDLTFKNATNEILKILDDARSRGLTKDEKMDIMDLIEATLEAISDQKSKVTAVRTQLDTLLSDFQNDHTALGEGSNSAATAVGLAESERTSIEGRITELQQKLASARQKVTAAGIGLGMAIFIGVAAFALAVATGGAGAIVVCAVGVVGVGVSATFTGIFSAEINSLINEIAQQQALLTDQKRQVTALKGLVNTVDGLKTQNEAAKAALTPIQTMWDTLGDKLDGVLTDLRAERVDAKLAVQRMQINTARDKWADAAKWAESIQHMASGTQVVPVMQHRSLALAV